MAHKKGQGSSRNGRESESKRLGVKLFGGQTAIPGNIIVRQRGTKFHPGLGVGIGKDHTIFAKEAGIVTFTRSKGNRKYISILPVDENAVIEEVVKKTKKAAPKKEDAPVKAEVSAPVAEEAKTEAPKKAKAKKEAKGDDLKKVNGIGPAFEKRLNSMGIYTYADLAGLTLKKAEKLEAEHGDAMTSPEQWGEWIEQAKELLG